MSRLVRYLLLAALAPACGLDSHEPKGRSARVAGQAQTFPGSADIAASKKVVVDACRAKGASAERTALVLAVGMGETNNFQARERDAAKDGAGDAKNFSAFNVNGAFLKSLGWSEGAGPDLNDQKNLGAAVGWVLEGMQRYGEDGFLNFHRGGSTGFADGCSYGCADYRQCIRGVQKAILADPALLTDARRVAADIPHV